MLHTPTNPEQWAKETQEALQMAVRLLEEEKNQPLLDEHKTELYKYAPVLAAYKRDIRDKAKVVDMAKFAFQRRLNATLQENRTRPQDEVDFYCAYLDAHVAIDELNDTDTGMILQHLSVHTA